MIYVLTGALIAYLLGSVPTAYIFGKLLKGIDIRDHGSGNVGATNVFRTVGKGPGLVVFFLDFLKGFLAVSVIPYFLLTLDPAMGSRTSYVFILLAASVICGHIWPIFLKFRGGKGVATTAGAVAGKYPLILVILLLIWIAVFAAWRYVSLASITASVSMPILGLVFNEGLPIVMFFSFLCLVGVYGHRANIRRLIRGEEKKIL